MQKVVLVTGTSTGLGISIVVKLANLGYKVFATMRNLEKKAQLEAAATNLGVDISIKQLDVQDGESIDRCVSEIIAEQGHIDVLVNNAGAGFIRTTEQATEDEINWVMDVNFMGVVRCTKAVLPHMRLARSGHVVNVSSVGGLVGQPFNEIYCAAKFALEGYVESVSTYITPNFNVNFTNVEPGGIQSEFASNALAQFQGTGGMADDEYRPILENYIAGAQNRTEGVYQTSDEVADVVIGCIESSEPPIRIRTSDWSNEFCELKTQADPTGKLQQQKIIDTLM
ncbi:SDR family oxidoreductase [Vibrio tapetis subsp. quintayensis]|uniref:SDR family oxidoreductase n=1 Tax=Vibrio tapetis TaxID=52443 RepID=UPI0025B5FB35|nr:SDR family oxidoreductase [Vibrio tapetis]MDN3680540.1 SDR family oxidoreductase [Vibrio tapetis subsp. quintayensis]